MLQVLHELSDFVSLFHH